MAFDRHILSRLSGIVLLCLSVWCAPAQSTPPQPGQSAIGSSSADSSAGALSGASEHHLDINSQIQAPQNVFGPSVDDSMAQPLAPPVNTLEQMVKQKPNWTEMTPDEILGVQTSSPKEQQARELAARMIASGQPLPNQSALETFLMNRRLAETGSTNLNAPDEGGSFLDPATGLADPKRATALQNGSAIHSDLFNRLLENAQDSFNNGGQPNQDAVWARIFNAPATTAPTPAQQADMAAFQQLLQPTAPAEADKSGFGFPKPVALPDPNLEPVPAGYNPSGASFAPLESGVKGPKRLPALPSATTLPTVPSLTPTWGPQPPPWKRTGPQLFVEPVRQF
jgi:hypothetical protein